MNELIWPITRILMRYGVGGSIGVAVFGEDMVQRLLTDPDIERLAAAGVSLVAAVVVEGFYARAKKTGGAT